LIFTRESVLLQWRVASGAVHDLRVRIIFATLQACCETFPPGIRFAFPTSQVLAFADAHVPGLISCAHSGISKSFQRLENIFAFGV
jgi:hypothetical protein